MLRYEAPSTAPPSVVWTLLARPAAWRRWAPHLRGAWGLGSPEVREGAVGAVRLYGVVPVPARIVSVRPGRSWSWRVGMVTIDHAVAPDGDGGSVVVVVVRAPPPAEAVLRRTYGPLVELLVRRLAAVAAEERYAKASGPSDDQRSRNASAVRRSRS